MGASPWGNSSSACGNFEDSYKTAEYQGRRKVKNYAIASFCGRRFRHWVEPFTMCLGVPGKVVEMHAQDGLPMGKVDFGGITKEVCLAYTPEAQIGDYVLIHVGFAISRIDEAEAQETFSYLEEIDKAGKAED
jgi:hydrogenase expression/formation protein HypC